MDAALDLIGLDAGEAILSAGHALAVLDEDQAAEEVMFAHQLVQEYFAARALAKRPDPERVRSEWRAAEVEPRLDTMMDTLDPADPLPPLAGTGWEETTILAAAMSSDPASYLRSLRDSNLVLAGTCGRAAGGVDHVAGRGYHRAT